MLSSVLWPLPAVQATSISPCSRYRGSLSGTQMCEAPSHLSTFASDHLGPLTLPLHFQDTVSVAPLKETICGRPTS